MTDPQAENAAIIARYNKPLQLLEAAIVLADQTLWDDDIRAMAGDPAALRQRALAVTIRILLKENASSMLYALAEGLNDINLESVAASVRKLLDEKPIAGEWGDRFATDGEGHWGLDAEDRRLLTALDAAVMAAVAADNSQDALLHMPLNQLKLEALGCLVARGIQATWGAELLDVFAIALGIHNPVIAKALKALAATQRAEQLQWIKGAASRKPLDKAHPLPLKGTIRPAAPRGRQSRRNPRSYGML